MILTPNEIRSEIVKRGLTGFAVFTDHSERGMQFRLEVLRAKSGGTPPHGMSFTCRVENLAKAPDDWTSLVEQLLARWSSVGAWQYISAYGAWQSCASKSTYECSILGAIPEGLKVFPDPGYDPSSDIGPQQTLIDISMNPGRPKMLAPGMSFYPTAEMWLGPHFWQYAKCTKAEALAADFWLEARDTPHYTYLKCWPTPFTRPDGEQGRMQQRLWQLFFHEDCEWPPGSGTICDEPMYGPPELWPAGLNYPYPTGPKA